MSQVRKDWTKHAPDSPAGSSAYYRMTVMQLRYFLESCLDALNAGHFAAVAEDLAGTLSQSLHLAPDQASSIITVKVAPQGMYRVVGADTFDNTDWVISDKPTLEEAITLAKQKTTGVSMLRAFIHDDTGRILRSFGQA